MGVDEGHLDEDVRGLLERATRGVHEIDLVPAALTRMKTRRRRRTAAAVGGALAAAAFVGALAMSVMEPGGDRAPDSAAATELPRQQRPAEVLEANERLVGGS